MVAAGCKTLPDECKSLWRIAGPVILTGLFQFLIEFVTVAFAGHIGKVELAAVSTVINVIQGLSLGLTQQSRRERSIASSTPLLHNPSRRILSRSHPQAAAAALSRSRSHPQAAVAAHRPIPVAASCRIPGPLSSRATGSPPPPSSRDAGSPPQATSVLVGCWIPCQAPPLPSPASTAAVVSISFFLQGFTAAVSSKHYRRRLHLVFLQGLTAAVSSKQYRRRLHLVFLQGFTSPEQHRRHHHAGAAPPPSSVSARTGLIFVEEEIIHRPEGLDIINWWQFGGIKYPTLRRMAHDILAIPVTTVASESAFSTSGRILSAHRCSPAPNMTEALMCMQAWSRADMLGDCNSTLFADFETVLKDDTEMMEVDDQSILTEA
ncbi:uncharacterized protein [Aegilops tauschii subsp. strangulata]|nr:uncharacterized protein LOC109780851 [Aegilops tauschii subsp. strangulata]